MRSKLAWARPKMWRCPCKTLTASWRLEGKRSSRLCEETPLKTWEAHALRHSLGWRQKGPFLQVSHMFLWRKGGQERSKITIRKCNYWRVTTHSLVIDLFFRNWIRMNRSCQWLSTTCPKMISWTLKRFSASWSSSCQSLSSPKILPKRIWRSKSEWRLSACSTKHTSKVEGGESSQMNFLIGQILLVEQGDGACQMSWSLLPSLSLFPFFFVPDGFLPSGTKGLCGILSRSLYVGGWVGAWRVCYGVGLYGPWNSMSSMSFSCTCS